MNNTDMDDRPSELAGRIRQTATGHLIEKSAEPIPVQADGLVRTTHFVSRIRPLVIDANELRADILRIARTGQPTRLVTATAIGAIRLYCARHVVREVDEHLPQWAVDAGLDAGVAVDVWRETHRLLLVCVEDDDSAFDDDEAERLEVLATSPLKEFGDPDDLPTARLALTLSTPLISRDHAPLHAVYGTDYDVAAHRGWIDQFAALGEAHVLSQFQEISARGLGLATIGIAEMVRRYTLYAFAIAVGVALGLPPEQRRALRSHAGSALAWAGDLLIAIHDSIAEAERVADLLPSPATPQALAEDGAIARRAADVLAHSARGSLPLDELSSHLGTDRATTAAALGASPRVIEVAPDAFQLGEPLG